MRRLDSADVDGDQDTTEWLEYIYHQNGTNNVAFLTIGDCFYDGLEKFGEVPGTSMSKPLSSRKRDMWTG